MVWAFRSSGAGSITANLVCRIHFDPKQTFGHPEIDPLKESVDALDGVMRNLETVVIPGADHLEAVTHPMFVTSLIEFLETH